MRTNNVVVDNVEFFINGSRGVDCRGDNNNIINSYFETDRNSDAQNDVISFTQQASPAYPKGIFAAIDDDTSTVGVGWYTILNRTGLSCGN